MKKEPNNQGRLREFFDHKTIVMSLYVIVPVLFKIANLLPE